MPAAPLDATVSIVDARRQHGHADGDHPRRGLIAGLDGSRAGVRTCVRVQPAVLHADLDAFFASVEQRDDPALRGRPVLVGGRGCHSPRATRRRRTASWRDGRPRRGGCVLTCGLVRPRMDAYVDASKAVFEVFRDTSPVVEGVSIDEAFIDVHGMAPSAGSPDDRGAPPREVRERSGCRDVGVARTSTSPRWRATPPNPTACSSWRPTPPATTCATGGGPSGHRGRRRAAHAVDLRERRLRHRRTWRPRAPRQAVHVVRRRRSITSARCSATGSP